MDDDVIIVGEVRRDGTFWGLTPIRVLGFDKRAGRVLVMFAEGGPSWVAKDPIWFRWNHLVVEWYLRRRDRNR